MEKRAGCGCLQDNSYKALQRLAYQILGMLKVAKIILGAELGLETSCEHKHLFGVFGLM